MRHSICLRVLFFFVTTVSIGIKTTFTFREAAKDLVAAADAAMYLAKRAGGNRVVQADDFHQVSTDINQLETS